MKITNQNVGQNATVDIRSQIRSQKPVNVVNLDVAPLDPVFRELITDGHIDVEDINHLNARYPTWKQKVNLFMALMLQLNVPIVPEEYDPAEDDQEHSAYKGLPRCSDMWHSAIVHSIAMLGWLQGRGRLPEETEAELEDAITQAIKEGELDLPPVMAKLIANPTLKAIYTGNGTKQVPAKRQKRSEFFTWGDTDAKIDPDYRPEPTKEL